MIMLNYNSTHSTTMNDTMPCHIAFKEKNNLQDNIPLGSHRYVAWTSQGVVSRGSRVLEPWMQWID